MPAKKKTTVVKRPTRRTPAPTKVIDVTRFPRAAASKAKTKFPYNVMQLGLTVFGWIVALTPKLQAVTADVILPARIYAIVTDHLFGVDDGEESVLWTFLMEAKPDNVSVELHLAIQNLVECIGRMSADIVLGIAERVMLGRECGDPPNRVIEDCRLVVTDAMDQHGMEADIQAVLDAK
uniref:Uncharacterized protein n=1 Tax=viral metagenome TaxID=1070528 RepID=A0A6M3M893_9ZZZZ